jgi:excisionase family DNA binding protein
VSFKPFRFSGAANTPCPSNVMLSMWRVKLMEKLLNINQLSELLQVKKSTVYSWVHTGRIPYVKVNGALRFKEGAIYNWIENQSAEINKLHRPVE